MTGIFCIYKTVKLYSYYMDVFFMERTWLIVLGIALVLFELLMGAASGFDIALVGVALSAGGVVHFYSYSWEYGIVTAIVIIVLYFVMLRSSIRKKLLVTTQKIGIDSLIGKTAQTVTAISAKKAGQVILDGEVWRSVSSQSIKEAVSVEVLSVEGVSLTVAPIEHIK